jgi:hypothetical protein
MRIDLFATIRALSAAPRMEKESWQDLAEGRLTFEEEDEYVRRWIWIGAVSPFRSGGWTDLKTMEGAVAWLGVDPTLEVPLKAVLDAFEDNPRRRVVVPPPPNPGGELRVVYRVAIGELLFTFRSSPEKCLLDSFAIGTVLHERWDAE